MALCFQTGWLELGEERTGKTATRILCPSMLVDLLGRSTSRFIVSFRASSSAADEFQLPIYCSIVHIVADSRQRQSSKIVYGIHITLISLYRVNCFVSGQ